MFNYLYILVIFRLSNEYPPKSVRLLIRDFSGKIIAGTVTAIDYRRQIVRVSNVTILEIVGLKHGLEPIYDVKRKVGGFTDLSLETLVYWENLPDYLESKLSEE